MLIHAGPFGNVAHANNSIIEDRVGLKLADYVITEAGFASDLGSRSSATSCAGSGGSRPRPGCSSRPCGPRSPTAACRSAGWGPRTWRRSSAGGEPRAAHRDRPRVRPAVRRLDQQLPERHGGRGRADARARARRRRRDGGEPRVRPGRGGRASSSRRRWWTRARGRTFHQLTPDDTPIKDQVEAIATRVYGADGVDYQPQAEKDLARMDQLGFGTMPVCMAKTHLSLTHDPSLLNRPRDGASPSAAWCRAPARDSSSCSAATCSGCRSRQDARLHAGGHRRARQDDRAVLSQRQVSR